LAGAGAETLLVTPSLALIDADLRLVRSTPAFEQGLGPAGLAGEDLGELEPVLAGKLEAAELTIGETPFAVEAVTDSRGVRHALLHSCEDGELGSEDPLLVLRPWLHESNATAWVKDLEGRYLYANPRFLDELGTDPDRLIGHLDTELEAGETVDGPRLALGEERPDEPLQLEYTVPPSEGRKARAVMRFVLRDDDGEPIATCGVAAPLEEAQLAREEAGRLMEIAHLTRMDVATARAYALEHWGLVAADGTLPDRRVPEPDPQQFQAMPDDAFVPRARPRATASPELVQRWDECVERLTGEAHRWLELLAAADTAASEAQAEAEAAKRELDQLRGEFAELERTLTQEREQHAGLIRTLGDVRARIAELDGTVDQVLGGRSSQQ
jgi:PAS domain-containing protein